MAGRRLTGAAEGVAVALGALLVDAVVAGAAPAVLARAAAVAGGPLGAARLLVPVEDDVGVELVVCLLGLGTVGLGPAVELLADGVLARRRGVLALMV